MNESQNSSQSAPLPVRPLRRRTGTAALAVFVAMVGALQVQGLMVDFARAGGLTGTLIVYGLFVGVFFLACWIAPKFG